MKSPHVAEVKKDRVDHQKTKIKNKQGFPILTVIVISSSNMTRMVN